MIRVGFIGVPGSGKTSTSRALAAACRRIPGIKNVEHTPEYARRYIAKMGSIDEVWEQYRILNKQIEWEETLGKTVDILITDSPIYLSFAYAQIMGMGTPKEVMVINDIFSKLNKLNSPKPYYDIIFHIPPHVEPVRDGIRTPEQFEPKWRVDTDRRFRSVTQIFMPSVVHELMVVELDARVKQCIKVITEYAGSLNAATEEIATEMVRSDNAEHLTIREVMDAAEQYYREGDTNRHTYDRMFYGLNAMNAVRKDIVTMASERAKADAERREAMRKEQSEQGG